MFGMKANIDIRNILFLARRLAAHRNNSLTTVSLRAAGQGLYFSRLEAGQIGLTFARLDKVMNWFSENWPEELDWPKSIPRPSAKKDAA